MVKALVRNSVRKLGFDLVRANVCTFHSDDYLRHNARRLEHLASLNISVAGRSVLEVGAGIGDHSHYYIDRGCKLTITEARSENLRYLKKRYPGCDVQFLDMERPSHLYGSPFDVVHCYGLLYHLSNPEQALEFLGCNTARMLFLETCVSFGASESINPTPEPASCPTEAYSGTGCRPTRPWVSKHLQKLFEYVYIPKTQPNHEEFPLDWTAPEKHLARFQRSIFIAARERLENEILTEVLIDKHRRHT